MAGKIRQELVTAGHYLCIGLIAQGATVHWHFNLEGQAQLLLLWLAFFVALSIIRLIILVAAAWVKKDHSWQTISRRNW